MVKRYVSIWFPYLVAEAYCLKRPELRDMPVAIAEPEKGKLKIRSVNFAAEQKGIQPNMVVADCRAIFPDLEVFSCEQDTDRQLLHELALWCIAYTPVAAIDGIDGLLLDVSGCVHLWGSEQEYLSIIVQQLKQKGFTAFIAIADTIGMAWAAARYYQSPVVIESAETIKALIALPASALRLEPGIAEKLDKLGLYRIAHFIDMPPVSLRKRFGPALLQRLHQATGKETEYLKPVVLPVQYQERLPCMEPICTASGIEIALKKLLSLLCTRLLNDRMGLRSAILKGYRVDGNIQQISIGTNKPSRHSAHLFKLFELKIASIEPALGIELFILEAPVAEDMPVLQESMWSSGKQNEDAVTELLDRISGRLGEQSIQRYLPQARYWPEYAITPVASLQQKAMIDWPVHKPRPIHLLKEPELIEVAVPIPDYPPMLFIHQGKTHKVKKADGPERIEQEWWLQQGLHRDYYYVEDENGCRYWLFRQGHYHSDEAPKWFLHGFFG